MKKIFLISLLCVSCIFVYPQQKTFNTIYVDTELDSLPICQGGQEEFYQYVMENFRLNNSMKRDVGNTTRVLIVDFIVDTSGVVSDIKFQQSSNTLVELEMERIIMKMPKWRPGYKNGSPVTSRIEIPIKYIITDNEFLIKNSGVELVVGNSHDNTFLKVVLIFLSVTLMYFFLSK